MQRFVLNLAEHRLTAGLCPTNLAKDYYFEKKRIQNIRTTLSLTPVYESWLLKKLNMNCK
jgi:hypothetical protein